VGDLFLFISTLYKALIVVIAMMIQYTKGYHTTQKKYFMTPFSYFRSITKLTKNVIKQIKHSIAPYHLGYKGLEKIVMDCAIV